MNKKRILEAVITILVCIFFVAGCGVEDEEVPTIQLSLWADEREIEVLESVLEDFKEIHKNEAVFDFTISKEGEDTCKETVLSNPKGAADIFSFAYDQLDELYNADTLLEVTDNVDSVIDAVGGSDSGAATAVTRNGKIYAYPKTSGNGYYLYYNKRYFDSQDIESIDDILSVCAKNNKKFTMDYSSGWYTYSFFRGAGLTVHSNEEGTANECNWNATDTPIKGIDVVNSMLDIATNDAFVTLDDDGFIEGVESGEVIAGINGPWNAQKVENAWGDDYAATKLPTYTVCGEQKQMYSFAGYKMIGINANTKNPEWCMKIVEYLTSDNIQLKFFEVTGECPANEKAAANESVKASPAVAALAAQAQYADFQQLEEPYWKASSKLGITLASGNLDGRDLQELLDETTSQIKGDK